MENLLITPKTKIAELLDAYPQLEEELIQLAPQFKKLKNPVLRKTIARVTTLAQAALVGGLRVEDLITNLRGIVGQEEAAISRSDETPIQIEKPSWFSTSNITETLDVREKLNQGEHPIHDVLAAIKKLKNNQIVKVIVPFIPAPMIEKTLSLGYQHWLQKKGNDEFWVYFIH